MLHSWPAKVAKTFDWDAGSRSNRSAVEFCFSNDQRDITQLPGSSEMGHGEEDMAAISVTVIRPDSESHLTLDGSLARIR